MQVTMAEGKKNLSSSFMENSNSGTWTLDLFNNTSLRIVRLLLGIAGPETINRCRFITVNLSLKSLLKTNFLSAKSKRNYNTKYRSVLNVPKVDKNPRDPNEKGRIGGQGSFWKIEEIWRRDPSPPQEMINCAFFKWVSVSSLTKCKLEADFRILEGRRDCNLGEVSNWDLGKFSWNHLCIKNIDTAYIVQVYLMINEAPLIAESLECLQARNIVGSSLKNDLAIIWAQASRDPPASC